jgi:arylsulfatase A-like enzyme
MTSLSRRQFLATGMGAAATLASACRRPGPARPTPHPFDVLIVVLDTVRFDYFAMDRGRLTPGLHRLAADGVQFTNAWANSSWSLPSQATILTGAYAHEHRADWPDLALAPETPTLAEILREHGYVTGAFSSNSAWITPEYLGRGFLRFQSYSAEDHVRRTTQGRVINRLAQKLGAHPAGRGRKAPAVNEDFLDFVDAYPDRPFFGYVCHMDVNQAFYHRQFNHPFWSPDPPVADVVAAYHEALPRLDANVVDLLDGLRRRNRLDRTIVVITSDHGQSFGPENPGDHDPEGHGSSLFPEQTRVPLVVLGPPDVVPRGAVVDTPVALKSIAPGVAAWLGVPMPSAGAPLALGPAASDADPAVAATLRYDRRHEQSLATGRWFYRRDFAGNREQLFDLAADPLARIDVGPGATLQELRDRCDAMLRAGSRIG